MFWKNWDLRRKIAVNFMETTKMKRWNIGKISLFLIAVLFFINNNMTVMGASVEANKIPKLSTSFDTQIVAESETEMETEKDTESEIEAETERDTETKTEVETEEKIAVTELDMGEYEEKMVVGEKQLLSVTVLPMDATETTITYTSSNTEIATINGMGRITAKMIGTTTITASCDGKSASFVLQVTEEENTNVPVTDIEIGSYEAELEVDNTLTLSATVVPSDATNSTLSYRSSDESIATVSSSGEVKGISAGKVIIYVSADSITKEVPITVKVATTGININKDYLVLKPQMTFQLSAEVTPAEAKQSVTYRSVDKEIATVSEKGLVTAKKAGNTTVIISNGESSVAVSVIVNQQTTRIEEDNSAEQNEQITKEYAESIQVSEVEKVNAETLYYLYSTGKMLEIIGDGYRIEIDGTKIVNYENEFYTDIQLTQEENGVSYLLNQGKYLCGDIKLYFNEPKGKYLYLYNEAKDKYELLQVDNMTELTLTTSGEYWITDEKIVHDSVVIISVLICGTIAILTGVGVYIVVKKKYWFW